MSFGSLHALSIALFSLCLQALTASPQCCPATDKSAFCIAYRRLGAAEQSELRALTGELCSAAKDETAGSVDKRKPNFIRFGRSGTSQFVRKGSDPNFLRFGRSAAAADEASDGSSPDKRASSNGPMANFLRFGRSTEPNFTRLQKSADPNFLRFGKRGGSFGLMEAEESSEPNFLRFGRNAVNNNFLRFGRSMDDEAEEFNRELRKPNFLRFG